MTRLAAHGHLWQISTHATYFSRTKFPPHHHMHPIRISAKRLTALAAPDFCPRCFWLQLKCHFKMPYQIFPGIFSSIDIYSKKVTNCCFEKHGHLPQWLTAAGIQGMPTTVPHHSRFF